MDSDGRIFKHRWLLNVTSCGSNRPRIWWKRHFWRRAEGKLECWVRSWKWKRKRKWKFCGKLNCFEHAELVATEYHRRFCFDFVIACLLFIGRQWGTRTVSRWSLVKPWRMTLKLRGWNLPRAVHSGPERDIALLLLAAKSSFLVGWLSQKM